MKYLAINDNKGFYWNGTELKEIDKINKEDLLALLDFAETDDFEIDEYSEDQIGNKAHQIIYQNIYTKLCQFLEDKEQFESEANRLYNDAIQKYHVDDGATDDDDESDDGLPF